MPKIKGSIVQGVGAVGALLCLAAFIHEPSFPTPDKLFVFLFFVFMAFHQAWDFTKRFLPFVLIILIYESFRSFADQLNTHVNYAFAPHLDRLLFGNLPTVYFQNWLWSGHVRWYDIALYVPYMMFFMVPLGVAVLVWQTKDQYYWRVVASYSVLFFAAYVTFLLFPAAPPWMAAQNHYIHPIIRISSEVWGSLGIHNFPSLYNHLSPNSVAAFPSLHAGVSTLFAIIIFSFYGWRWGLAALLYPLVLCFGVIYEGEHYATDVVAGIIYAFAAFYATPGLMRWGESLWRRAKLKYSSSTKNASKSKR